MQQQIRFVSSIEEIRRLIKVQATNLASDQSQFKGLRKAVNSNSVLAASSFKTRVAKSTYQGSVSEKRSIGKTFSVRKALKPSGSILGDKYKLSEKVSAPKDSSLRGAKVNSLGALAEAQENRLRLLKNIAFYTKDLPDDDTVSSRIKKDVASLIATTADLLDQTRRTLDGLTKSSIPPTFKVAGELLKESLIKHFKIKNIEVTSEARHMQDAGIMYATYLHVKDLTNANAISRFVIALSAHIPPFTLKKRKGEKAGSNYSWRILTDYVSPERLIKIGRGAEFTSPQQLVNAIVKTIETEYDGFIGNQEGMSPVASKEIFDLAKKGGFSKYISKVKVDDITRSLVVYLNSKIASETTLHQTLRSNMFAYLYEQMRKLAATFDNPNAVKGFQPARKNKTWQMRFQFAKPNTSSTPGAHENLKKAMKLLGVRDMDTAREFERLLSIPSKK